MATNKDLIRWSKKAKTVKTGYCCYQDDRKSKWELFELGSNSGYYGWNWTAYLDTKTETLYVSCYRNVPKEVQNKAKAPF